MAGSPAVREARLRPEFAELYPGVEPDVWYTAATIAEHMLVRLVRQDAEQLPPRVLDASHFDFRGSDGLPPGPRPTLGARSTD
ncbi:MAG: hypothetical protein ACJ8DC_19375 [Gemmatimonadales bacterium]